MSSKPASALAALLVSNDAVISEQISGLLRKLAASTLVSNDLQTALRLLSTRKFEAIVVDLQLGESGLAVLEKVRASPSNRTTVVFAISGSLEDTKKAFEAGSNFVIDRPIVTAAAVRTFKAAYSLIVRERRRYFRCRIQGSAHLRVEGEMKSNVGRLISVKVVWRSAMCRV